MTCEKVYLGQELSHKYWDYGIGSVYLNAPLSCQQSLIRTLENTKSPICLIIPYTKQDVDKQNNKLQEPQYDWNSIAMSVSSAILFWIGSDTENVQRYIELGSWIKSEKVFVGIENSKKNDYLHWLWHKEQHLYPAETIDQLVNMAIHWLRE